jgi:hypothetical protein
MNKTLALFIGDDYLIAGVEPLLGKFTQLSKRGINKFPLYFFIDKVNHKIDYSFIYKKDFLAGNQDTIGEFLNQITDKTKTYLWYEYENDLINLLLRILEDIKNAYFYILNSISGDTPVNETDPIPVHIAFSDNIKAESQKVLKEFLIKQNFVIQKENQSFPELIVNQFLQKNDIEAEDKKFAVLEALGENLNMSVISIYSGYDRERSLFKVFNEFGTDPRIQVISKKIVDDINRYHGLLKTAEERKVEYKRHFALAEELIVKMEESTRPYLPIQTSFAVAPNQKLSTTLSVEEIEQLTSFHVQQISRFFIDHFLAVNSLNVDQLEKIILVGNTLNNELVKKEFGRFGNQKLIYLGNDDVSWAIMSLLALVKKPVQKPISENKDEQQYKEIPFIVVGNLKPEQKIKLSNNNTDKAKGSLGPSMKEFEYLGSNKFRVLSCTRGLLPGDIATSLVPNWVPGIQLDFDIERAGKNLGKYRTRPVVKIEIM